MPLHQESFLTKEENDRVIGDFLETVTKNGFPAYVSKDEERLMVAYPLEDQNTKRLFGEVFTLIKMKDDILEVHDIDLTIGNKKQKLHFLYRLSASNEANEYYMVALPGTDIRFVAETVNRYAVWDEEIKDEDYKVRLSALAFRIVGHDSIEEYNKSIGFVPFESKIGRKVIGLAKDFCAPRDEETKDPYTYFLGTVQYIKDVKVKFSKKTIEFSVIFTECFSGIMPVVIHKEIIKREKLEKGRLIEVSAFIKADLAADATLKAIVKG